MNFYLYNTEKRDNRFIIVNAYINGLNDTAYEPYLEIQVYVDLRQFGEYITLLSDKDRDTFINEVEFINVYRLYWYTSKNTWYTYRTQYENAGFDIERRLTEIAKKYPTLSLEFGKTKGEYE